MPGYYSLPMGEIQWEDVYTEDTTAHAAVGEMREAKDGSRFVYTKAGAALTVAHIASAPVADSGIEATVTVAHAIGTTDITVTAPATITANQYKDGYLWVNQGTGVGDTYRIKSNAAIANGSTGTFTLWTGLRTAWSTSDTDIMFMENPYNGTLLKAYATNFYKPVGVSLFTVTSGSYAWLMTRGYAAIKLDVAAAAGLELDEKHVVPSPNHAGQGYLVADYDGTMSGYHHVGYQVGQDADITDNDAQLCYIDIH